MQLRCAPFVVEGKTTASAEAHPGTPRPPEGVTPMRSISALGAAALLARNPSPTEAEIRSELDIHLCRCGAYDRILRAIRRASEMIGKKGGQEGRVR